MSRNVARLERNLGVRLFQRSTRKLTLTDAGERFLLAIKDNLDGLQQAISDVATDRGAPQGAQGQHGLDFGADYVIPLLPAFLARYPGIRPDWQFTTRQVDLIAEGYDVAIGGGIDLAPGIISRALAPLHLIAVASPAYLETRTPPADPTGLSAFDGIAWRSSRTGRIRERIMRNAAGTEIPVRLKETIILDDPEATCRAALHGLGITSSRCVTHFRIWTGALVRLVPNGMPMVDRSRSITRTACCCRQKPESSSSLLLRHLSVTVWPSALPGA